jgi:hypothetical protein
MRNTRGLLLAALIGGTPTPAPAIEGSTLAGPIGGTDIRTAQLPPPGLYGGVGLLAAEAFDFVDERGKTIPALGAAHLQRLRSGPFLLYVPEFQFVGGSFGVLWVLPNGIECGRLFGASPTRCIGGLGDPYVEIAWSRFFGTVRPSRFPDALPILEGMAVAAGFGVVFPTGRYDAGLANNQGLTMGNNIWDFAPNVAFTYTTAPIIAEGTEISAKLFWNNYLTNPATQYTTGTVLNVDFAVSERIGRFQIGVAGFYAVQVADDMRFGRPVPPDGRRGEAMQIGPIVGYDMPELAAAMKFKVLASVITANTVKAHGFVLTFAKKFQ